MLWGVQFRLQFGVVQACGTGQEESGGGVAVHTPFTTAPARVIPQEFGAEVQDCETLTVVDMEPCAQARV